jgi:hypothetical protein
MIKQMGLGVTVAMLATVAVTMPVWAAGRVKESYCSLSGNV